MRLDIKEVVGAHAGWSDFIDAVAEEFVGTFLIAPGDAEAFCGQVPRPEVCLQDLQKLVERHV